MSDHPINPFPGLRPFRTDEEYLFFGRETQCQDLLRLLGKRRFIGVLGSSGTGKSSLVRAGLLPALYRGSLVKAGSHWSVALCRPGGAPIRNLAQALLQCELWDHLEDEMPPPGVLEIETILQRSGMGLREIAQIARMPGEENLLIVVDQFEELFRFHQRSSTTEDRDTAEAFVNLLLEGARDADFAIHVVLTMRSGFFGECAAFEGLSEVINRGAYLVPRLTRDQLKEAIEGPIKVSGAPIAPRLIQRLLNDAGGSPDELPVLQHALMRTWNRWHQRDIPHEDIDLYHYEEIGGMKEALSRHADEVYLQLSEEDQQIAKRLFKTLTEKDPENRGIRRPISLERLRGIISSSDEAVERVIDVFRSPEVSFLMPSADQPLRADSIIDISHESLMRVWKRLGRWVDEETQSARIYQRLTETAALWEDGKADLYHDPELHIARQWYEETRPNALWAAHYGGGFTRAIKFLGESQRKKEEEKRAEEEVHQRELASAKALADERTQSARCSRRFSVILAALTVLLAFLAAAAFFSMRFARDQARFARDQARIARDAQAAAERARQAVSQSFSQSDYHLGQSKAEARHYGEALAFLSRALKNERSHTAAGDRIRSLLTEVSLPVTHFHHRDTRDIAVVAFTPDSRTLITGSEDNFVRVWDIDSNQEQTQWEHEGDVLAIAVSHDGRLIATGDRVGQIFIYDRPAQALIGEPLVHQDDVNSLVFSRDDRMLLTCSDDNSVRIWDWATGNEIRHWLHDGHVNEAAFTADEGAVISVSDDDTARVWEIAGNREALRVTHDGDVTNVDIHREIPVFVTASKDHTAKVWAIESGDRLVTLAHDDIVREARFSPDGRQIGTCSHDRTVRLWDFPSGVEKHRWSHRLDVDGFDFSPDGKLMASASDDQTIRIWETVSGLESPLSPLPHPVDGDQAKFSPDGEWLTTVADNEVRVWRFEDFREPPLRFDLENVTAGALSPTGQWAAAGSENGTVSQWSTDDGQVRHPPAGHETEISAVIYSPDGDWLISGDLSGKVMVWEARTGQQVTAPLPHPEAITSLVMPANGRLIVVSGSQLQSWSVPSGQRGPVNSLQATVNVVAVDPAGNYVGAGCDNGATVVCHANTLVPIHSFTSSGAITTLDFSRDDLMVSGSDDWSARLWSLQDGTQFSRTMGHGGEVTSARFHPSGDRLITGALDQRARMWSAETGSILGNSFTHSQGVLSVGFSHDGLRVVTGSADQTARVWDLETSTPLTQGLPHNAAVTHAVLAPGGRRLFTVAPGDGARIWIVSLGAEGQLAPDLFLEGAEAIGGLQLNAANQLVPLDPRKRRMILDNAEREIRRMSPNESNAYLQFIRSFLDKHGAKLRPKRRALPGPRPPLPRTQGFGPPRPTAPPLPEPDNLPEDQP